MKLFKFILILFISVSITSCSDESNEPPFTLSNANVAGTYNIGSLSVNASASAEITGVSVVISKATNVGDTFEVNFEVNSNGTYTVNGQYRVVSTVTPTGESPITNASIILVDDSGTYEINTTNNTITFNSSKDDFLSGNFNIDVFNETTLSLSQESEEVDGPITAVLDANISFTKQ